MTSRIQGKNESATRSSTFFPFAEVACYSAAWRAPLAGTLCYLNRDASLNGIAVCLRVEIEGQLIYAQIHNYSVIQRNLKH